MSTQHFTLGIDLTAAGARTSVAQRATAGSGEAVSLGELADYLTLAGQSGADFVTFGESFRLDDVSRNDAWLDPAIVASRLAAAGLLEGAPAIVSALPAGRLDPIRLARAIAGIHERSGGRAGWQVPISPTAGGVHAEIRRVWAATPAAATGGRAPLLVTAPADVSAAVVAGKHSDVVRLRVRDRAEAARRRDAIRAAAEQAGRNPDDVRVLVEAVTVIGQDAASALFRADLVRELGPAAHEHSLTVAGTAAGVAEELAQWVGAVDGFVLVPGSLPTDAVAIARELAPALASRGLIRGDVVAAGVESDLEAALEAELDAIVPADIAWDALLAV